MYIQETLDATKDRLIQMVEGIGLGNCYVVAVPMPIPMQTRRYVEIYYKGTSTFDMDMGGNLGRYWNLGVSLFVLLETDQVNKLTAINREMIELCRAVTQVLHLWYEPIPLGTNDEFLFAQPSRIIIESEPQVVENGGRYEIRIDQTYSILSTPSTWEQLNPNYVTT